MSDVPLDTNVILRYLIENPLSVDPRFQGVFPFFERIEEGTLAVTLPDLVLFQAYFVLTSFYSVPREEAASKLRDIVEFRGIRMERKAVVLACLEKLEEKNLDLVDAYLLAWTAHHGCEYVYSFDTDLQKNGLKLLPVE